MRLIDADALTATLEELMNRYAEQGRWEVVEDYNFVATVLMAAPAVDAVEVVRCCDCKYGIWDDEEAMWKCVYSAEFDEGISEWLGFCEYNDGNHFCSYGERKNNG